MTSAKLNIVSGVESPKKSPIFIHCVVVPPVEAPMPWEIMGTVNTLPKEHDKEEEISSVKAIRLIASLDELPAAPPVLNPVTSSVAHESARQLTLRPKTRNEKRTTLSRADGTALLSLLDEEYRTVHWKDRKFLDECARNLILLRDIKVDARVLQKISDHSQFVAGEIHILATRDSNPATLKFEFNRGSGYIKPLWTVLRNEGSLVVRCVEGVYWMSENSTLDKKMDKRC